MAGAVKYTTPELRLSYTHLFEARTMPGSDKPKFSVSVLIPKTDTATIKAINDAVAKCAAENPDKIKKKNFKHPLRDGDTDRESEEYAGHMFLSVSSKDKPIVLDENKEVCINPREIYSGMYGRVSMNFFAYNHELGGAGVGAALNSVMKTADGEPLGNTYTEEDAKADFSDDEADDMAF